jgi:hypothetical protein
MQNCQAISIFISMNCSFPEEHLLDVKLFFYFNHFIFMVTGGASEVGIELSL